MIPRSLSASALHVAELCLSRYFAENIERGRGEDNAAASLGSAVHGALEYYVKACHLEKDKPKQPSLTLLEQYYDIAYMSEFKTADTSTEEYADGWEMLKKWWVRTSFEGVEVLSCEVKEFFEVKFPDGTVVPFNYIWDRFDKIGPAEYKVVDYKTIRWAIKPDDLSTKIQSRFYGLAVQIKHPEAEKIWVEFDQLRHDPVGMVFTREDNVNTWKYLKRAVQRIYDYNEGLEGETLNTECRWCVRKSTCTKVGKNANVGGVHSFVAIDDVIARRAQLDYQATAAKAALDELDKIILAEAQAKDTLEFMTDSLKCTVGMSSRRAVDGERVENVIGPELFKKYGNTSITLADVDKLLKGTELSPYEKKELESLIYRKVGEAKVKTEKVTIFGDKE